MNKTILRLIMLINIMGVLLSLMGFMLAFLSQNTASDSATKLTAAGEDNSQVSNSLTDISSHLDVVEKELSRIRSENSHQDSIKTAEQSARTALTAAQNQLNIAQQQNETNGKNQSSLLDYVNTMQTLMLALMFVFAIGMICSLIGIACARSLNRQISKAIKESLVEGKVKGGQALVTALDKNPSALLNMLYWVRAYKLGKGNSETALRIFEEVFSRMKDNVGLVPFGLIGDVVAYDHQKHDNRGPKVKVGDRVQVIESGWQVGDTILRKPMVEKERT